MYYSCHFNGKQTKLIGQERFESFVVEFALIIQYF